VKSLEAEEGLGGGTLILGAEARAPSYTKSPREVFQPLGEIEPALRERIKIATGVMPALVQPGWNGEWNTDPHKRLWKSSGPYCNGDEYNVEKNQLIVAGVKYDVIAHKPEMRLACERDICLWLKKHHRGVEEGNAIKFLVASAFPYLPDTLVKYSGVSLSFCRERPLQWSRVFGMGEWRSVTTDKNVVVVLPPIPQTLDMTFEDMDRLQSGAGLGSEGVRLKRDGVPVTVLSIAGEAFWLGLSWFRWDSPLMVLEQVGLDAYILFPETYGDDVVYDTSVGIRIHWNPWKPYDLVRGQTGEGIMIRDGMTEFRVKYTPTIEVYYDGSGRLHIDTNHFRVDGFHPPGVYEVTMQGTLLRSRPAKEPSKTMMGLLNFVTVRSLPQQSGPLRISPESQTIRDISSTDIMSFVQSQLVTTANVREWMLSQYGLVSTAQIQAVLMKAKIMCRGQQYYTTEIGVYEIAKAGKYRTKGEYISAVPMTAAYQLPKELLELDQRRQEEMDRALALKVQEDQDQEDSEYLDLASGTTVTYAEQVDYWKKPALQSVYQHPTDMIARVNRTSNATVIAGELMVAKDLVTGDAVPVICTLHPLKVTSSTSTEFFDGKPVKILAFQDGKDVYRNQVNIKYHGGLRDAYLATQATKPPRKVFVYKDNGLMRLGNTFSFRGWSADTGGDDEIALCIDAMANGSGLPRLLKDRPPWVKRLKAARAVVGECPYFVWDPEPKFVPS